ncbi:MAG TPA: hypothetical protein V6D47_12150 [Oscillatoriaceae cyanobacterium]
MKGLHQGAAALVLMATLAGCGAQTIGPVMPLGATQAFAAQSANSGDVKAAALIANYEATTGTTATEIAERAQIASQLGNTDSDTAASFLENQYDQAKSLPSADRAPLQDSILNAMADLDTYDPTTDDALIAAGPGATPDSQTAYLAAKKRKSRHSAFIRWATEPLHWLDEGIRWLYSTLNGGPAKHKKKPAPAPAPDPGPPAPAPGM